MLWLALLFPQLPIDRLDVSDADTARAVSLQEGPRRRIMVCNKAATDAGIHPGLALKNAYTILPDLIVNDYDEDKQLVHLEQLTQWALSYSSWVSPEPPDTLLIEIASSLKLYGGLDTLLEHIRQSAATLGVSVRTGIAPTPTAAILLARVGITTAVRSLDALTDIIDAIPIKYLPLDMFTFKGLRQSGIHTLGELQTVAPAAITRRFGHECTDFLYRLDGRLPDPKPAYRPAESFSEAMDLSLEAPDTAALSFPLNRLLISLAGYLKARDLGVRHLDIILYHHRHPPTSVELKFLDATSNTQHLFRVTTERLGTTTLCAPVIRIRLASTELAGIEHEGKDLLLKSQSQSSSIQQVLDKLMARLGKDALYTPLADDDHRPEKAWLAALLENHQPPTDWPARPIWLLKTPEPASTALELFTLPERIENGWWNDEDVRRDYFIARNPQGSYYWVFRLRHAPEQLWIHGLFA